MHFKRIGNPSALIPSQVLSRKWGVLFSRPTVNQRVEGGGCPAQGAGYRRPPISKEQLPMPQVTGAVHEVGVDQLFFSTTDARGVIRHSNNVII